MYRPVVDVAPFIRYNWHKLMEVMKACDDETPMSITTAEDLKGDACTSEQRSTRMLYMQTKESVLVTARG